MYPLLMVVFFLAFGISMVLICSQMSRAAGPQPAAADGEEKPKGAADVTAEVTDVINQRIAQLDEKLVDLHTRTAAELKTCVDEAEGRLQTMEKEMSKKLAAATEDAASLAGGAAAPSTEHIPDLKRVMQERMDQFDSKLIDMHTKVARRLHEAAAEVEQKILAQGDDVGKGLSVRIGDLEEKIKILTAKIASAPPQQ